MSRHCEGSGRVIPSADDGFRWRCPVCDRRMLLIKGRVPKHHYPTVKVYR